ncbi:uncharacterized protein LOC141598794 [Silene latifolia]|uniref:uncharacterized protein LOC141598794 n=1 Tax=Silene latifolia TaxID=37657 RepID=UPI003D770FF7
MGTKVQIENYLSGHHSTRDLSREYDCYNDVNLPNGQFYYGFLQGTITDSPTGFDKEVVKQTMLKHEAIFKEQVYELHRLYRVQRDLMDEVRRKETLKRRIPYEESSSSSPLPLHLQSEDAQRCNGSSFPSTSLISGRPLLLGPDNYQSSPISAKGKSIQAGPSAFRSFHNPKNSEVSESQPTKLRKGIFDLELPADEYIDTDEVEQFGRAKDFVNLSLSPDESRKPTSLGDLNEPLNAEEFAAFSSADFLRRNGSHTDTLNRNFPERSIISSDKDIPPYSMNGSLNGYLNNLPDSGRNAQNWFQMLQSEQYKDSVKPISQGVLPQKAPMPYQPVPIPWDQSATSWGKPDILGQKPTSIQPSPFLHGVNQSNDLLGYKWNPNNTPGAKSAFVSEPPLRNGFHQGSSATAGVDIKEMNLNVALPNGKSDSYINPQGQEGCKLEDPYAVLPWLRGKGAGNGSELSRNGLDNETGHSRNGFGNPESSLKILGVSIFDNRPMPKEENHIAAVNPPDIHRGSGISIFDNRPMPKEENHIAAVNPTDIHRGSGYEEIEDGGSRKRKGLFDMNIPCEASDSELDKMSVDEAVGSDQKKNFRNTFDLNSCITEEETCGTSLLYNSSSVKVGTGIDLEALINLEKEDNVLPAEDSLINETGDGDSELAKSAASAIVAMSSMEGTSCLPVEAEGDDPLHWFVSIACSSLEMVEDDALPEGLEDFEYMILRQKECTPEEYLPKPSTPDFPITENGTCVLTNTRTRKGQARRGRQRRDFQRDILPGLTTLSRHEVTEDLQTFGGLLRETGYSWQSVSNRRNGSRTGRGRGRPRSVVAEPSVVMNTVCALPLTQKQEVHINNVEISVDDRSLRGWGKTTRRPRRQRCPAGNPDLLVPLT